MSSGGPEFSAADFAGVSACPRRARPQRRSICPAARWRKRHEQLVSRGYLQSTHGSGTFICRQLPERLLHATGPGRAGTRDRFGVRLSSFGNRMGDDFAYLKKRQGSIWLSHWGPDLTLFPLKAWYRSCARSLRDLGPDALDYAEHSRGYEPLCEEIARYVSRCRAVDCSADQVLVVNGSQQGLDLTARLLLEPGDEVAVENPGYHGASRVFEACGAKLRPVPVDREGIVCSLLGETARLAYVARPSISDRRAALIAAASWN